MRLLKASKIRIHLLIRSLKDVLNKLSFASKAKTEITYTHSIEIIQEIKPSATFENKVYNLARAAKIINEYSLMPGEVFSFWRIIKNPNKGFKKSRTIQNGKLVEDTAGGICQVSGIVYHICILAGLQILERHNHSIDIYTDETRFTPLGLDATVVYGYKDLRIKNTFTFPIRFDIEVKDSQIRIKLLSTEKIEARKLLFETKVTELYTVVRVLDENQNLINTSKFNKLVQ
jgi:vancomycin resistance protein VanW